jgi:tetratricopeptide (TPR) repeat protein
VPELGVGAAPVGRATILVDDSASRALGWDHAVGDVGAMIRALAAHGDPRITVAAFDQEVAPISAGPASGWGARAAGALRARGALGASDLGAALAWAAAHKGAERVIVVTDGVATAGDTDAAALGAAARATGAKRLDVVLAGGIRDEQAAHALAGALPDSGLVLDLASGPDEVARRLELATRSSVPVSVDGAAWVWPDHLDGLQPGDGATIYAALGRHRDANVTITVGDHAMTVTTAAAPRPLIERAAAEAQVLRLEAQAAATTEPKARAAILADAAALSIKQRVLSDETALLVLETDADYARYGLDRRALADILVVGKDGLELSHRDAPAVIATPANPTTTAAAKGKDADKAKQKEEAKADEDQWRTADSTEIELDGQADQGMLGSGEAGAVAQPLADLKPEPVATPEPPRTEAPPPPPPAPRVAEHRAELRVGAAPSGGRGAGGQGGRTAAEPLDVSGRVAPDADGNADVDTADDDPRQGSAAPWTGDYATIMTAIGAHHADDALAAARAWHDKDPGDLLGLVALGDALEATGDRAGAARAYGSIIDLYPSRADLRRFAGERLERIADRDPSVARALVLDTYRRAVEDRPDHLTGHRLYAYALLRAGRYEEALAAIERGLDQPYPPDRFRGGQRILTEDLGIIGAAWAKASPRDKDAIAARIAKRGGALATGATTRFVLYWETDDNDVDFHIRDARGGHAFYKRMHLRSGGDLYADVTTGYGPEEFAIDGPATAGPYQLAIHYFSRGPMGYGMGTLEILHRDARGAISFEHRPFIVMNDKAYVDLGSVAR